MYRKSMRSALEEARAYSAVNEVKVSKGGKTLSISKRDVGVYQAKGWSLQEVGNFHGLMMDRLTKALKDKLSKEGGAAGFDDLKKTANKMGVVLTPANLKGMPGIKQHRDGDYILENKSSELINLYQIKNKTPEIEARIAKLEKELKVIKREETELEEQKRYMLTYGKKGEKVKAFYSDDHSDVQKKASELRGKGFVVDKMGLTQPMSKLRDRIPEEINTDTYADSKKKMLNKEGTELVEFTLADYRELESDNQHDIAAKKLIDKFGTSQEKSTINDINRRHAKTGYISGTDFRLRTMIVNRYYSRLK